MRPKHITESTPRAKELEEKAASLSHELARESLGFKRAKIALRSALIDEMTRRPIR